MNKYYSLVKNEEKKEANINIYGDITSWPWLESDVSSYNLSKQIDGLDVDTINIYINSYGGEVSEGLAIANALMRHKAKVKTVCDGFACSIAGVIFMAGDERIMNNASLLMVHNAWTFACGNSKELEKAAEDLKKITQASINLFVEKSNISEEEIHGLFDNETWIEPKEALEYGFATSIISSEKSKNPSQNAKQKMLEYILLASKIKQEEPEEPDKADPEEPENPEEPEEPENPEEPEEDEDETKDNPEESNGKKVFCCFFNAIKED